MAYPTVPGSSPLKVTMEHGAHGHLRAVRDAASQAAFWWLEEITADGQPAVVDLGNGLQTRSDHDPLTGLLERRRVTTPAGDALHDATWKYDDARNPTGRLDGVTGSAESFTYDALSRLTDWGTRHADGSHELVSYALGDTGNVLNVATSRGPALHALALHESIDFKYDFLDRPHTLTRADGTPVATDARGRLSETAGRSVTYNSFDLPRQVTTADGAHTFDYDAAGVRFRSETDDMDRVTIVGPYGRTERRSSRADTVHSGPARRRRAARRGRDERL